MTIAIQTENKPALYPRIYVACLDSYVNGRLHGEWIDAAQDVDDIREEISEMMARSPMKSAEEHAIHDHEGFGEYSVSEYDSLDDVAELAALIEKHGESVASCLWNHTGGDLDAIERILEDGYTGCWEDLEFWAEDHLETMGELDKVPESLRGYIDLAAYARDKELNSEIFTVASKEGLHVFWSRR